MMSSYEAKDIVIVAAKRTPIGSFQGSLSTVKPHELGAAVIKDILENTKGVKNEDICEVIMGQVLTAGHGQNPARQAAVKCGIPYTTPATTINMICGSGLKAVVMGTQAIKCGDCKIVIAGGQESMSQAAHCTNMRAGLKMGNTTLTDTLLSDGLLDAFHNYHMGITAENVAKKWNISRKEQDTFAMASQTKAGEAHMVYKIFDEEKVPVHVQSRKGTIVVSDDEYIRLDTTLEKLSTLKPCFITDGSGTVTAGNSSGVNDGAAAVMIMSYHQASSRHIQPMARIVSWAQAGVDPCIMGTGPIPATKAALSKAGWKISDVDLFEINEAFASQSCAVVKDLAIDPNKVNINGGAIALGHPLGASGCRILVTLLYALKRTNQRRGLAALCIGGGMGIAICIERLDSQSTGNSKY